MNNLLNALQTLVAMKYPSVAHLLGQQGLATEAGVVARVVMAWDKLVAPDPDIQQDSVALTFEQYVAGCVRLLIERPETAAFKAVHLEKNLGDDALEVYFFPSAGHFENDVFLSEHQQTDDDDPDFNETNAVCIN